MPTQRYVAHRGCADPSIWIHYLLLDEDTGWVLATVVVVVGRQQCECKILIRKEKAYLHISVLLNPALFHPVPLCRLPPLLSAWQHFSAIYLHGEAPSPPPPSVPPVWCSLPLSKNKIKQQHTHAHFPISVSAGSILLLKSRGRLICAVLLPLSSSRADSIPFTSH